MFIPPIKMVIFLGDGAHGIVLPTLISGKLPHNYGTSPFSMGKSTINHKFSIAFSRVE